MAKTKVEFEGSVIGVRVWLDNEPVTLTDEGDVWRGERDVADGPIVVRMRIVAVRGTDWSLVVKRRGRKELDESDTTDAPTVDRTWVTHDDGVKLLAFATPQRASAGRDL